MVIMNQKKIAVISDIHSNYEHLLKTINNMPEVDMIINLGDIISKGNNHKECVDLLMNSNIKSLKGNCELYLLNGVDIDPDVLNQRADFDYINQVLDDNHKEYLKSLPMDLLLEINGKRIYFSHFLIKDISLKYPYHNLSSVNDGSFDKDCEKKKNNYDLMIFGHAHHKIIKDKLLLIPSIGINKPEYLLLTIDDEINYEFRVIE